MKKIIRLLALLLAATMLGGCAATEPEAPTAPPLIEVEVPYEQQRESLPYENTELTLSSIWLREDPRAQVLTQAAALFQRQTGARVHILWAEDAASAQTGDIRQIPWAEFSAMGPEETLDLTEMAEKAKYEEKSHGFLRRAVTDRLGFLGAIPQTVSLGGVYYNRDVFAACGIESAPESWEDFLGLCAKLREAGWEPLTMDQEDAIVASELHLRRTIGNEQILRLMGKDSHWNADHAAIAAMEQVALFVQEGNMAFLTPAEHPAGQNKMALSNSAMMIGTNTDCAQVEAQTQTELRWGMFPYPGQTGSGSYCTADMLIIDPATPNAQAAFDFVMVLTTGEFDQLLADLTGGIPADPSNQSPVLGAMEVMAEAEPEPVGLLGEKQLDAAVKLWSAWYSHPASYAAAFERSK